MKQPGRAATDCTPRTPSLLSLVILAAKPGVSARSKRTPVGTRDTHDTRAIQSADGYTQTHHTRASRRPHARAAGNVARRLTTPLAPARATPADPRATASTIVARPQPPKPKPHGGCARAVWALARRCVRFLHPPTGVLHPRAFVRLERGLGRDGQVRHVAPMARSFLLTLPCRRR